VNNWTAKIEYLYVDLGSTTCDVACSGGDIFKVKFNTNIVRGGINYRF
jgi:outer membrane immunogenic protein